jgi:hypothetical protein
VKLPNADRAFVDDRKLTDYCLNPDHLEGQHKARVFRAVLGLTRDDADRLRSAILVAAHEQEATLGENDEYGQRYVVDFVRWD